MNRTLFLITFFIFIRTTAIAQLTHSISIGPDVALGAKNLKAAKTGWGGNIDYTVKFPAPVGIHLGIGYNHFTNKYFSDDPINFIPVRVGLTGFIYQDQIFVTADAGVSFYHSSNTNSSQTNFSYGVGVGYKIYFDPERKPYMQVAVNYNVHNFKKESTGQNYDYSWVNIGVAFGLTWGRKMEIRKG